MIATRSPAATSVYPFAWNVLLSARAEGLGGVVTTMAIRHEPGAQGAPRRAGRARGRRGSIALGHPVNAAKRLNRVRSPTSPRSTPSPARGSPVPRAGARAPRRWARSSWWGRARSRPTIPTRRWATGGRSRCARRGKAPPWCAPTVTSASAEETAALIEGEGGTASVLVGDVSSADDCDALVADAAVDGLTGLVCNVGIGRGGGLAARPRRTGISRSP